eukprot:jgi/Ulvmu1/3945/UM018_0168.1
MASVASPSVSAMASPAPADEHFEHSRPGGRALEAAKSRKKQRREMLPPAPKQVSEVSTGQKVIDDEEFEAKLAAIIERDYFPDVKRLQNRLEWSEAAESNDPDKMANAQRNIVLRRAGFSVPLNAELPAPTSDPTPTPTRSTSHSNATPSPSPSPSPAPCSASGSKSQQLPEGAIMPPSMPLQRFTTAHNTEDHASMEDIVSADNARRRVRYAWAYEESDRTNADMLAQGHQPPLLTACNASAEVAPQAIGRPTALLISLPDDGGGTANATLARRARRMLAPRTAGSVGGGLQTTPPKSQPQKPPAGGLHAPKSALYYPPAGNLPLSAAERRQMAAGAPPATVATNTRFRSAPGGAAADSGSSGAAASPSTMAGTPTSALTSRDSSAAPSPQRGDGAGVPALEAQIGAGSAPRHGVATPSPSPSGHGSAPPMTWGEVGATPMVLGSDGGGGTPGAMPAWRHAKEAAADKARREMAASRARDPQRTLMLQHQQQQGLRRASNAMSPAARRMTMRLQGGSSWAHIDAQLRATYGHRTPGTTVRDAPLATPSPGAGASPAAAGLLGERTPERRPR